MKKIKIAFWITTGIIALFEGVLPALTFGSPMAIEGITQLGYPVYFSGLLMVYKVVGSLVLIIPKVPARIKEWAYAGFGIDFTAALASIWIVMGFGVGLILPAVFIVILIISYRSYHKMKTVMV